MNPDSRDLRILERLWSLRYASPGSLVSGLPLVPDRPEKRVVDAFLAWREQDLPQAVALAREILEPGVLGPRWASRARGVLAVSLSDLGRVDEALECHRAEAELARAADDGASLARATHDMGWACHETRPFEAAAYYLEAIGLARTFREGSSLEDTRESCALEALAILNLHDLRKAHGVTEVPEVPGLAAAESLALRGWPELAAQIRALRALSALDEGDEGTARTLAQALPEPESMRDVTAAVEVVALRARLLGLDGRRAEGRALLDEIARRVPERMHGPLHDARSALDLVTEDPGQR